MRAGPLLLALLAGCLAAALPASSLCAGMETRHLLVSVVDGADPDGQLPAFAARTQALLERVLEFWSADAEVERFGKIRVVLDHPQRNTSSSVFFWSPGADGRVRTVRVFGSPEAPQMLAHKLSSAVLPQRDKLLRNMLGILTERRLGNPDTFPMCGHSADAWVLGFLEGGGFLPLRELDADHRTWGMEHAGAGTMQIHDRGKQHKAYAEAGSFAEYLLAAYGLDALKRLHALSQGRERPFREVYGRDLEELERLWLEALRARAADMQAEKDALARLFAANPSRACFMARKQSGGR